MPATALIKAKPLHFKGTKEDYSLWDAIENGNRQAAQSALNRGANIHALKWFSSSYADKGFDSVRACKDIQPIHFATLKNLPDMAQFLLDNDASILAVDQLGEQAIHLATRFTPEMLPFLIRHGADVNAKIQGPSKDGDIRRESGNRPLHLAAKGGKPEIAKLLINSDADPNALGFEERYPIQLAASHNSKQMVDTRGYGISLS